MDKGIAEKWVAELRSGKHKQGKGKLECRDGSKCCLGVLQADVLSLPIEIDVANALSEQARIQAGISDNYGYYLGKHTDTYINLSANNDAGMTFLEIADTIERDYESI